MLFVTNLTKLLMYHYSLNNVYKSKFKINVVVSMSPEVICNRFMASVVDTEYREIYISLHNQTRYISIDWHML